MDADPNWAPAVVQFAQAVATALLSSVGPDDVSPQTFNIDLYNPGTNVVLPNLAFSPVAVQAAFIRYSVYRNSSSETLSEAGDIVVVYNPTNPVGNLWEISREKTGDAQVSFSITDQGQMQISMTAIPGTDYNANVFYAAQAMLTG